MLHTLVLEKLAQVAYPRLRCSSGLFALLAWAINRGEEGPMPSY